MDICSVEIKRVSSDGKSNIRRKICDKNKVNDRGNCFKYLGYHIAYEIEKRYEWKKRLTHHSRAMRAMNHVFKPSLDQKQTRIRIYKTSMIRIWLMSEKLGLYADEKEAEIRQQKWNSWGEQPGARPTNLIIERI